MKLFDIIGDVHGQAGKLERLFRVLGYQKIGGVYGLADRKAVFVGDLIDRGPAIGETLNIVKAMELYNPDKTWQPTSDDW